MQLKQYPAPHIRNSQTTRGVMADAIAALSFLYAMAYYYHGPRPLVMGLGSVAICLLCDVLCTVIARRRYNLSDYSAIVTGMILPLMMPASVDYRIVAVAGIFAIVVAKAPFGGVGHNVFNPAAAGFSFAAICFGDALFTYPPADLKLPLWGTIEFPLTSSPAFVLRLGGTPNYDAMSILLGKYPGPMGATNILVLIACLIYLVSRGTIRWSMPLSFFATVGVLAFAFPRSAAGGLASVVYELASGLLLFGGIFLLGDPVTTPKREMSKVAFAVTSGVMVMLFRHFGNMEEGITFALLVMNAAVWGFDMAGEYVARMIRRKKLETLEGAKVPKKV
ncbi:MAG TPA: RnfABCDGE type electron transport complex subunit D, partial [Clostridiales bacterium]|nr:RnfABCDGE type electron transport complex subunit D [Clostridiales bacterium]